MIRGCRPHSLLVVLVLSAALLPEAFPQEADCNGNGTSDASDIAGGSSIDCNGNGLPDECEVAPLDLRLGGGVFLDAEPRPLLAADLNGDGLDDLCLGLGSSSGNGPSISVLLNQGESAFDRQDTDVPIAPAALATGDFNGDGHLDLAARGFTKSLRVCLGDGSGHLAPLPEIEVRRPTAMAARDLDGDGKDELVVAVLSESRLLVFPGDARGLADAPTELPVGDSPISIAVEDFNGDGHLDLATANSRANDISLLWNRGDGTFDSRAVTGSWSRLSSILAGDFDGDAAADLLVVGRYSARVLTGDGKGEFMASTPFALPRTGSLVATGDLDRDGDLDVAMIVQGDNVLTILRNRGDAVFETAVRLEQRSGVGALTVGDLDGDGACDLAVGFDDRIEILIGGRRSELPLEFAERPLGQFFQHATLLDIDGDGLLDLASAGQEGASYSLNRGFGELGTPVRLPGKASFIAGGDLDGDGDSDLVTTEEQCVEVWRNTSGLFAAVERRCSRARVHSPTIVDLNGDGVEDVLAWGIGSVSVFPGLGEGQLGPEEIVAGEGLGTGVSEDFDADGDSDLAAVTGGSLVRVLRNRGDGTFSEPEDYPVEWCSFVTAGDLDGDGDIDLVTGNRKASSVSLLFNSGDGQFELTRTVLIGLPPSTMHIADMNGDAIPDVIAGTWGSDPGSRIVTMLRGRGGRVMAPPERLPLLRRDSLVWLGVGDLDGDLDADLVVLDADQFEPGPGDGRVFLSEPQRPGGADYRKAICTEREFRELSAATTGAAAGIVERVAKFLLPARPGDASLLPGLFQNVQRYPLHQDFLQAVFPDRFPALTVKEFDRLVNRRETRDYFVGVVSLLRTETGLLYGFSILAGFFDDPAELPTMEETRFVYESLESIFALETLVYFPPTLETRESAAAWPDPGFPVYFGDVAPEVGFAAYTRAVGYGRVRLLDEAGFREANERGDFSFQDVLVLERAPPDIEGVIGGVITAEPQGDLSHLAIRTARRKTPNAFVQDALEAFAPHEGKLVRLEVKSGGYEVEEATAAEAEVWWAQNRPQVTVPARVDGEFAELPSLLELDLGAAELPPEARFGGKATNLARLQQLVLTGEWSRYRETGFAIPARYYLEFLRANRMPSALDPAREVTYEEYVRELSESAEFQTSSRARFEALKGLRLHMRQRSRVDEELVGRLARRIEEVLGGVDFRVRFRSSSNVEDALEFNGAGLYDSTSVCAADDLDADDLGPSHCDPTREDERGIPRGLRRVWASLWNFRAYEERAFFGIEQTQAAMAILVNRAFVDERANGVAFTGNPSNSLDTRYVVSVQAGEESVVSPAPGILSETDLIEVVDGKVVDIVRASRSSLVPEGGVVLSTAELEELGVLLWHIDQNFRLDLGDHHRREVLLDVEFKIEANGRLAVKQVRPFLFADPPRAAPTFTIEIPPEMVFYDPTFVPGRTPEEALRRIRFVSGRLQLPTGRVTFTGELIEDARIGRVSEPARAAEPGRFHVRRGADEEVTRYGFDFEQQFVGADGSLFRVKVGGLVLSARDEEPLVDPYTLDGALALGIAVAVETESGTVRLDRWSFPTFLQREIDIAVDDGSTIRLVERFGPMNPVTWISPTWLVRADLVLRGTPLQVTEPFSLVYTAQRHHENTTYWVVLDPPVELPDLDRPVHIVEVVDRNADRVQDRVLPGDLSVRYLDEGFGPVAQHRAIAATVGSGQPFRRGDVNSDGKINLSDALGLLGYLFQRGESPSCTKSADADDDGTVMLSDAVTLLVRLFGGGEALAPPFERCGLDPTPDRLACEIDAACSS